MNKKPTKGQYLEILLRSSKTVFSTKDVSLLWGEAKIGVVSRRLDRYARVGKLVRIRRGIYVKDDTYNRYELATRIYTPAYISFETVLTHTGINFQYYSRIFVASYVSREIQVGDTTITYVRMKDYVLSNTIGIVQTNNVAEATKERAFLDRIYISKEYHFDNIDSLDWDKVFEMVPMYHNKRMAKKVDAYFEHYKNDK